MVLQFSGDSISWYGTSIKAIAYGNNYLPGYRGNLSYSGGLEFDYIIVHETGHEWWGNSVTTNDIDMWIHESFCTYSEKLCMLNVCMDLTR